MQDAITLGMRILKLRSIKWTEVECSVTLPPLCRQARKLNGSFLLLKLDKVSRAGNNLIFNSGSSLFDKSLLQTKNRSVRRL